ncbi:TPA: hypothetical protein ROE33_000403 [Campylobacter jejuni]|uniref:hypothetical protein n=1 Tax=Campylobacter TaxID=194 RepID=UPI000874DF54|nr:MULTISPECIES: hypothetical protein [Campylobacter]HDX3813272.1 hypothetical protein [Campylobacter coli]EAI6101825.1 hypothetical protein [Campylobacter jejuni]ECL0299679.1 hypothetical protein [Campylobacter jejuni]ECL0300971.1 hypothetical protein [Campylobacter jejuni]ECL3644829.1 hypothetical protein [Campylobacter jejuni]
MKKAMKRVRIEIDISDETYEIMLKLMKKRKYEKVEDLLFAYMGTMYKMELAGALLENDKNLSLNKT